MGSRSIEKRIREIAEQVAIDNGVQLVHTEVAGPDNRPVVRIFIDKPGGVTHEDCSDLSLQMGTILDVEDFIHSAYTLEVSSPGLERGLYSRSDFERFAGNLARMKTSGYPHIWKNPVGASSNRPTKDIACRHPLAI